MSALAKARASHELRTLTRIRYAILTARERFEPQRLTGWQSTFQWEYGHPKSWLVDGRIENTAFDREARKAFHRTGMGNK